uniref:Uncharacterized protein n=1 Tax=Phlebotomus papatasi TaxID=29031 RepID=A0A1B0DPQ2_PHLPP
MKINQLSPIERYAMRFVEETGGAWTAEQLKAAEAEIEQQKREWEANRQAALLKEEEEAKQADEEDIMLTYSSDDAKNQVKNSVMGKKRDSSRRGVVGELNCRRNRGLNEKNRHSGKVGKKMVVRSVGGGKKIQGSGSGGGGGQKRNNAKPVKMLKKSIEVRRRKQQQQQQLKKQQKRKVESRLRPRVANVGGTVTDVQDNSVSSGLDEMSSVESRRLPDDDFDSECSLDVMIDSNDAPESTDSNVNKNDNDTASLNSLPASDSGSVASSKNSDDRKLSSYLPQNHVDVNSPRTRSRGAVKINLWTLDVSPILPKIRTVRSGRFTRTSTGDVSEDPEVENVNGNVRNNRRKDSLTPTNRPTTKGTPPPSKAVSIGGGVKKRKSLVESGKNATLDGWVTKIPRLVNDDGVDSGSELDPTKMMNPTVRLTRRQSIMRANIDGGPS